MKILVADDDSLMRAFILISLRGLPGAEITEATDGIQALALLQEGQFDVVLLDWQMPGKDGIEIVRAVRAQGSRVPMIMVTAEAERERVIAAIQAGISDYLIKPFTSDLLWAKVNKFCGAKPGGG